MAAETPVSLCKKKVHCSKFLSLYWITTSSSVSHSVGEMAVAKNMFRAETAALCDLHVAPRSLEMTTSLPSGG